MANKQAGIQPKNSAVKATTGSSSAHKGSGPTKGTEKGGSKRTGRC